MAMQPQTITRIVSVWLFFCLVILVVIMVIGGASHLLESGMSITQWRPISEWMPPLNDQDFAQELEIYKALPPFQKAFPTIALDEFRLIYALEYMYAVLTYGLVAVALLPLFLLSFLRMLCVRESVKLGAVFAFGGLLPGACFYMAQNNLLEDIHFTPYRLSLQLGLQYLFFGLLLWQILTFSYPKQGIGGFELPKPTLIPKIFAILTGTAIFSQIILSGAVSGLHAGLSYNSFPRMDSVWIPEGVWPFPEWYKNIFEDATTVQFIHRVMAYMLALLLPLFWLIGRNNPHIAHLLPILFSIFVVQFLLGVLTLLFVVPIPLAAMHQANAILVFSITVTILHRLFLPIKTISYDIGIV